MKVNIEFEGSQQEFEQFCRTPQRLAEANLMQHYQRLLQGEPMPIQVEGQPLQQALPPGYDESQVVPDRHSPMITAPTSAVEYPPMQTYLPGRARSSRHWLQRLCRGFTTPMRFFCICAIASVGVIAWSRSQPRLSPPVALPVKGTSHQRSPAPKKFSQPPLPTLPLVPRPKND